MPSQRPALADHQHSRAMPGSVDTAAIVDGAVTGSKLAAGSVDTSKIVDGTVAVADLASAVAQALVPTGAVVAYGGTSAPSGWLLCDGAAVSRTTFAGLFAVVGTAFGAGDGSTTFNVPDLRQRFPLGKAAAGTGATLGGTGGAVDHTHDLDTSTSHARYDITVDAASNDPELLLRSPVAQWTAGHSGTYSAGAGSGAHTRGLQLAGLTATANAPFQAVNYLVKT